LFARVMVTYTGVQFFRGHGVVSPETCHFTLWCLRGPWGLGLISQTDVI